MTDERWIACPKCRIANLATQFYCDSCGAVLDPNAIPPRYPSGASPWQWALITGICTVLIGSAIWAALAPDGVAGKAFRVGVPIAYGIALLLGFARAVQRFRKSDVTGGITLIAVTILFGLATLPAILHFTP